MAKKILQVNFKYKFTEDELLKRYDGAVDYFVKLEGLEMEDIAARPRHEDDWGDLPLQGREIGQRLSK